MYHAYLTSVQVQSFEQEMSKTLAMVRRHLNSHNPTIHKIPAQILVMIASHLKVNAAFVTKVTHICHHWRVTLLSCPHLWTYPNFAREEQARSFLHRSEQLPIHVDLIATSPSESIIELLCLHSARMHTLRIGHFAGLHKLLYQPLESLRTLEVATPEKFEQVLAMRSAARNFLVLTTLIVRHNPGGLGFRGSGITYLCVGIPELDCFQVAELISLLRSCVLLEVFQIENGKGLETGLLLLPNDIITLPHLRSFTQTLDNGWHRTGMIGNLHLPPICSVVLRCMIGPTNGYPPLKLPYLRDMSYLTNVKRVKAVFVEGCLGRKASIILDFVNDRGIRLTTTTEFFNHAVNISEEPAGEMIRLPASAVEVLCVHGHRYITLEDYRSLTTLILSGTIAHLYLELLAEPKNYDTYKKLGTLVLFVAPSLSRPDLVRLLLKAVQTRAEAGHRFKTITFVCPHALAPNDLTALRGLGECVERVELLLGNDPLDWTFDKYFLNGG